MKMLKIVILALFMVTGLASAQTLYGAKPFKSAADHLKLAALYRESANAIEDALILEHRKIKQTYPKRFQVESAFNESRSIQELEKRCDAIINDATKLRDHLLDFSRWHRMRAAELQHQ